MKKMMMALAALCVAGAASAVTLEWSLENTSAEKWGSLGSDYNKTLTVGGNVGDTATFVARVTLLGSNKSEVFKISELLNSPGGDSSTVIRIASGADADANGQDIGVAHVTTGNEPSFTWVDGGVYDTSAETATKYYAISVVCTKTESGLQAVIAVNGKTLYTADIADASSLNFNTFVNYEQKNDGSEFFRFEDMAGYDGALTEDQLLSLANGAKYDSVPEPTALALLALGVAGLALRRKAV